MDFLHNAEAARGRINQWVEEQTRKRITNLLAPGTLTPATRLVLTNAIYFKGRWAEEFDQQDTQEADFTRADGTTVKTMFMATRDTAYRYAELRPDDTRNELVFDQERFKYELQPNPDGLGNPQCGQSLLSTAPHRPQKFIPSGLSKPQLRQCMVAPSLLPLLSLRQDDESW